MSAPLPAREARDPEAKADLRRGSMSSPTGSYPSPQTLNPSPLPSGGRVQRAQPSLAGGWGYPPTPTRSASRQGSGRTPRRGAPTKPDRRTAGHPPGGRVQRGRSPLWRGLGGTPPPQPLPAPLPVREVDGRRERGRAHGHAPLRDGTGTRRGTPSGGRVQKAR